MSRIDEALRRSHSRETTVEDVEDINGEAFRSPWDFQHTRVEPGARATDTLISPLAPVTDLPAEAGISGFSSQWNERLVVSPEAQPFLVEQFRRLAATLHQAQALNNIKAVMVTSASPSDGKTLTAINLALILSESYGRQVLLVDADLRRPSIRDVTHLPNVLGLSEGLRSKTEQKLTVFRLTKNLSLLPAGRPDPDPMASLTSGRMRRILGDACSRYDWVVLDAPPVGTVADGSILAEMVDGTLLVVRAGQTDCGLTKRAIEAVGRERILGVVLNGVEDVDSPEYAAYYGGAVGSNSLVRG